MASFTIFAGQWNLHFLSWSHKSLDISSTAADLKQPKKVKQLHLGMGIVGGQGALGFRPWNAPWNGQHLPRSTIKQLDFFSHLSLAQRNCFFSAGFGNQGRAKIMITPETGVKFENVAGIDEARVFLNSGVDFGWWIVYHPSFIIKPCNKTDEINQESPGVGFAAIDSTCKNLRSKELWKKHQQLIVLDDGLTLYPL